MVPRDAALAEGANLRIMVQQWGLKVGRSHHLHIDCSDYSQLTQLGGRFSIDTEQGSHSGRCQPQGSRQWPICWFYEIMGGMY